jgi:hypothetical protein
MNNQLTKNMVGSLLNDKELLEKLNYNSWCELFYYSDIYKDDKIYNKFVNIDYFKKHKKVYEHLLELMDERADEFVNYNAGDVFLDAFSKVNELLLKNYGKKYYTKSERDKLCNEFYQEQMGEWLDNYNDNFKFGAVYDLILSFDPIKLLLNECNANGYSDYFDRAVELYSLQLCYSDEPGNDCMDLYDHEFTRCYGTFKFSNKTKKYYFNTDYPVDLRRAV